MPKQSAETQIHPICLYCRTEAPTEHDVLECLIQSIIADEEIRESETSTEASGNQPVVYPRCIACGDIRSPEHGDVADCQRADAKAIKNTSTRTRRFGMQPNIVD